uniref:SEA domain-containing protein n=1 Tax=Magallana gigas TaxID=29159 RepID=A0A8W8IUQ0_MAGGI
MATSVGDLPFTMGKNQFHRDDLYVPSEQNGSTDDSLKRRTKYRTTIIIVLVSSCFVALASALTVVFVFSKPNNEKQVLTEGEISVLQNFTADLHDKTSDTYKKFTTDFSAMMENGLQAEFLFRRKCYVTDLRHFERFLNNDHCEDNFYDSYNANNFVNHDKSNNCNDNDHHNANNH